jgi:Sulfotransferase family
MTNLLGCDPRANATRAEDEGGCNNQSLVEIRDVTRFGSDAILGQGIDSPIPGDGGEEFSIEVAGWVVGRDYPAMAVEILSGGTVIKGGLVCLVRQGVLERFPGISSPSGYSLRVGLVGLPSSFELTIRSTMGDGSYVVLGRIAGQRRAMLTPYTPRIQPLMLTSLGRMGTTWMMRLLSAHPSVVAFRDYPYEVMPARYWMHQLRVLAAPADYGASSNPDSFGADLWKVGHNPFYGVLLRRSPEAARWLGREHVHRMAAFCQETIDAFYGHVAELQGQANVRYFAEKSLPDHIPTMMQDLYPRMREIVLVRDPRDVVCSMLAFNRKRGYQSFGRERAESDAEFVRRLAVDLSTLASSWDKRGECSLLVRYEDLIAFPGETLRRIFAYLNIDDEPSTIRLVMEQASEDTYELSAHRTSEDPAKSVGRWRADLPAELVAECNNAFAVTMSHFGYQATGP